jgi:arylsulfatase A-like enzyme
LDSYTAGAAATGVADAAIAKLTELGRNSGKPFYLQAGCIEPHRLGRERDGDNGFLGTSLRPDTSLGIHIPKYLRDTPGTRTELAELQGAVRHMDAQMGRVLQAIRDLKLEQNTLVVFTTDHGIAMPRAKCSVYEPGLQTSFILRYPSRNGWHGGTRRSEMISNVDYLPTLLAVADVPVPAAVQGSSFAPLLNGASFKPRETVFGEMTYHDYYDPRRSIRTESHKLIVNFSSAPAFMDPSQSWRPRSDTVTPPNHALAYHNAFELYDLRTDPWEQHDLAADVANQGTLDTLRKQLLRHMRDTKDPILDGAVTSPLHRRSQAWLQDAAQAGG